MKSLGYANGWTITPYELVTCEDKKHKLEPTNEGRCLTRYTCPICEITFLIDSSD